MGTQIQTDTPMCVCLYFGCRKESNAGALREELVGDERGEAVASPEGVTLGTERAEASERRGRLLMGTQNKYPSFKEYLFWFWLFVFW